MAIQPTVGVVAICQHGVTGLITKVCPNQLRGGKTLYKGVRLLPPSKAGQPWQSVKPTVVGDMNDFVYEQYHKEWGP